MKHVLELVFLMTAWTAAAEEVTWIRLDAPPYYILSGPQAGEGIADKITELLVAGLPEYTHRFVSNTPVARIGALQKAGDKVAMVTVLYSKEREDYLYFSLPVIINPPYALVTSTDNSHNFGSETSLSLKALLDRPDVITGVADRLYGEPIDGLLRSKPTGPNLMKRMGNNVFTSLLQMVDPHRLDFIIGTPFEVSYARRQATFQNGVFTYGITEVGEQYLLSYAAFPKTPWGLALRDKVNKILIRERKTEAYRSLFTNWLDARSAERLRTVWPQLMETTR